MNNAESTVSTSAASRIESTLGSVFVNAKGESETSAGADAILFRDGIAGLAVSVAVDKATDTSTVNGTIIAGASQGSTKYSFNSAQVVNIVQESNVVTPGTINGFSLRTTVTEDKINANFQRQASFEALVNPFGISGKNAIGPSVIVSISTNKTIAEIDDNAMVRTGSGGNGLAVTATQDIFSVGVSQTGAKASEFGVSASVTVDKLTSETRADIAKNVTVSGASVLVKAIDTANRYGIDGGYVLGEQIGVGVATSVNLQERTTLAYIGSESPSKDSAAGPAKINVSGSVSVKAAEHVDIFALSLAAAVLTDPTNVPTSKQPPVERGYRRSICIQHLKDQHHCVLT